jgi:hypothetical protein
MEQWLPIPGYEGFYEVSDEGRVRSIDREVYAPQCGGTRPVYGIILRLFPYDKIGHLAVSLWREHKISQRRVHGLVLLTFVGPRPPGHMARHFPDRDPANNRLSNLQWGTAKENSSDMIVHGTRLYAEAHPNSKLTRDQVQFISHSTLAGVELADMFNVGTSTISRIKTGVHWAFTSPRPESKFHQSPAAHPAREGGPLSE